MPTTKSKFKKIEPAKSNAEKHDGAIKATYFVTENRDISKEELKGYELLFSSKSTHA